MDGSWGFEVVEGGKLRWRKLDDAIVGSLAIRPGKLAGGRTGATVDVE